MLRGYSLHQHIRLRSDDGGVDKTEEEEPANQGADSIVGGIGILAL